jgi:hypothetical protein
LRVACLIIGHRQDTLFNGKKNKVGFLIGNGIQYIGQLIGNNNHNIALKTTYYYQVNFYQLQYYRAVLRHKRFGVDMLAQPQYNTAKYKMYDADDDTGYLTGHELGLNLGLLFRENTSKNGVSFICSLVRGRIMFRLRRIGSLMGLCSLIT